MNELPRWRRERPADASVLERNAASSDLVRRSLESPRDQNARRRLEDSLVRVRTAHGYERVFVLDVDGTERLSVPSAPEIPALHLVQDAAEALRSGLSLC